MIYYALVFLGGSADCGGARLFGHRRHGCQYRLDPVRRRLGARGRVLRTRPRLEYLANGRSGAVRARGVLLHGSGTACRAAARQGVLQRRLCGRAGLRARRLQLQPARRQADAQRLTGSRRARRSAAGDARLRAPARVERRAGARKANLEWRSQGRQNALTDRRYAPRARYGDQAVELGAGGETHQRAVDDHELTTQQGTPIADDQNTLRVGPRGPALLEDFHFREKLFHFDHERIPERVVNARGFGAHGFFETYDSLADVTSADLFQRAGEVTPAFVRFSTVVGSQGSFDLARDVRGFAVKLYTQRGNWDLVGNNMPVFFIQDPIKFPDLVHAAKAGARPRLSASAIGARQLLGFRLVDARKHAHGACG